MHHLPVGKQLVAPCPMGTASWRAFIYTGASQRLVLSHYSDQHHCFMYQVVRGPSALHVPDLLSDAVLTWHDAPTPASQPCRVERPPWCSGAGGVLEIQVPARPYCIRADAVTLYRSGLATPLAPGQQQVLLQDVCDFGLDASQLARLAGCTLEWRSYYMTHSQSDWLIRRDGEVVGWVWLFGVSEFAFRPRIQVVEARLIEDSSHQEECGRWLDHKWLDRAVVVEGAEGINVLEFRQVGIAWRKPRGWDAPAFDGPLWEGGPSLSEL